MRTLCVLLWAAAVVAELELELMVPGGTAEKLTYKTWAQPHQVEEVTNEFCKKHALSRKACDAIIKEAQGSVHARQVKIREANQAQTDAEHAEKSAQQGNSEMIYGIATGIAAGAACFCALLWLYGKVKSKTD